MMIPGEETMPTAMTLAVKFLSDNPVALAKLVEENMEMKMRYLIQKGWCVLASFISVHMDEDIYENPYQFDPWRWDRINGMSNSNICFTPFGGGQRLCPGLETIKARNIHLSSPTRNPVQLDSRERRDRVISNGQDEAEASIRVTPVERTSPISVEDHYNSSLKRTKCFRQK
ncbi:3-epi-6-deoxocathasterone 23-monooxygenase [Raphanus sativus]|nr:3-epi-6-deoxocathasterone 23-monooxygenase [Raphanus sativus]